MKHLVIFFATLFVASATASDVIDLSDSNWDGEIIKHDMILVEFFAPWCGHCKKLAPEYEIAATKLKNDDPPIPLAKVDCTENTATCGKFGVSGYPTLKIFRGGEFNQDYNGGRNADGIMSTLRKISGPASKELKTMADYEKFLNNFDAVVVGYYEAGDDNLAVYEKTASALRDDYKFAHTTNEEVLEAAGAKNVVILHRPKRLKSIFEDQQLTTDEKPTKSNLKSFLEENLLGLCGHITNSNFEKFPKPLVVVADQKLDYVKNPKGSNYWRNRVMKWSKNFQGKLNFAIGSRDDMSMHLPDSGLPESDASEKNPKPVVVVLDKSGRKYVMSEAFGQDSFQAFLQSYLDGEIEAHIKSEPVPEPNDGPVTVVVGKNFDEVVMDESKDVLVEFYAPWCGHCKSLAPKWDELGEKLKDNDDIVIAKMDATANDQPKQFAVSGFPTIYWAPKDNKQNPEKYQGGREVADFLKFLKSKSSSKIKTEL
uniref:Protein disulfide-isomerase n=1 Tax=Phallusia mammillata TaxID=59560 RepID=A0A6F9DNN4_9ASCI|nr:protein disulfide-isomerase A3 [Phallusia mammillata]